MPQSEIEKSYFVSFCIEQYKTAKNIDGVEAASLFFDSGVADYLANNYEVLHTQSRQWLMEEIDNLLGNPSNTLDKSIQSDTLESELKKNLDITNQNLHLLLPGKVSSVSAMYADEHHCTIQEAMRKFYASNVYQQLEREETKLWHLGAVALYEMWVS